MIIEKVKAKNLVNKTKIDDWWWTEGGMNPYQGCFHNCTYCDGKSEGYHMHEDFGTRIKAKINSPQLLEKFLKKNGFIPVNREKTSTLADFYPSLKEQMIKKQPSKFILSVGGGVTDVYQPIERRLKITKRLLEILYDYDIPVQILTKNKNVLRDLKLLKKINDSTYANVSFSITLGDNSIQKIFEPRASSTSERFEALRQIREAGIHGGVLFVPCLPWIGDTDENMVKIFQMARDSHAEYVILSGLTLKPGRNKSEYLNTIKNNFPELYNSYTELYGNDDRYGNPDYTKIRELKVEDPIKKGIKFGHEYNVPVRMPRYVPEGRIKDNLRISTILFRISYFKTYYHYEKKYFTLRKAAHFIETYNKDLGKLSKTEIKKLPIDKNSIQFISEVLDTGGSSYLESIDQADNIFYN
ncbi:MAG: radical SAM protein [Candidatus Hodarchaeales archaeon]